MPSLTVIEEPVKFHLSLNVPDLARAVGAHGCVVGVDLTSCPATASNVTTIAGDLRDPATILEHPELHALIDFEQPFALLLVAIFHFIADEYDPEGLAAAYRDVLPSGGYLTLSHLTSTGADPAGVAATEAVYQSASSPMMKRCRRWRLETPAVTPWAESFSASPT